jgi:hypothetical protein
MKFIKKTSVFIFVFYLASFGLFIDDARADNAKLFFSPGTGSFDVGKTFTVRVMVDSGGGVGINAVEANVNFDPSLVKISSISVSGSIFKLWTNDPTESLSKISSFNKSGTISFGGGLPSSYKGSSGNILSISFSGVKTGTAKLSFSGAMILAADGQGTNVYGSASGATFNIVEPAKTTPPPVETKTPTPTTTIPVIKKEEPKTEKKGILPPAPEVSSITHPMEEKWYSNNGPEFTWKLLLDITGVGISVTEDPAADPGSNVGGIVESKKYERIADGTHYFNIKLKNQNGWGPITHRKFQVDVTPPDPFDIAVMNSGDQTDPSPVLVFNTKDAASGIDKYQVIIDNEASEISPRDFKKEPYKPKVLKPGEHNVTIAAFDKANNAASSSKNLIVEPLKTPIITEIPKSMSRKDSLVIRGTSFYPQVTISISIQKSKNDIEVVKVTTDNEGNWSYFRDRTMDKGSYEIWAKIIDKRGAESYDTSKQYLEVVSPNIITAYGLYIIIFLAALIIFLSIYIWYERRNSRQQKERLQREINEAKKKTGEIFLALSEEVGELIEYADKRAGVSESERRVKDKIEEALSISEEFITKEIDDVEKEIK